MWRVEAARLAGGAIRWKLASPEDGPLDFARVLRAWDADAAFRAFWIEALRQLPFESYAWECPPVTTATAVRPFECVFVSSPALARLPPDPGDFAEHFRPGCEVATFANLGGDAVLVAPCPEVAGGNFSHLGSFTATATAERQQALWEAVGRVMVRRIGARPVWLSTAGLGVAWLHVRLDSRPKYYRHLPYAAT